VVTFSFAFSSFYYYAASLGGRIDDDERARYSRRGDRFWLLGCILLFLTPSLILFTIRLLVVAVHGSRSGRLPVLRDALLPSRPGCGKELSR
jgi:hypothetical protein